MTRSSYGHCDLTKTRVGKAGKQLSHAIEEVDDPRRKPLVSSSSGRGHKCNRDGAFKWFDEQRATPGVGKSACYVRVMFLYCLRLGLRFGPRYLTSWIGKHSPGPAPPFVGVPERQVAPVPIPDGGRRRRRKNVASGPN